MQVLSRIAERGGDHTEFLLSRVRPGLVILLIGCTRWESYELPPTPEHALPSYVRVSAPGRPATVLVQPFVRLDTLYGRSQKDTLGFASRPSSVWSGRRWTGSAQRQWWLAAWLPGFR